jgi:hypothetical protein
LKRREELEKSELTKAKLNPPPPPRPAVAPFKSKFSFLSALGLSKPPTTPPAISQPIKPATP